MALKPPQHPRLPLKPEPAEYNHRHGNKSCEPRRRRDPGNRPIDISQDRNTQQKVQRADDAALAGGIHKAFEEWFIVITKPQANMRDKLQSLPIRMVQTSSQSIQTRVPPFL